jgi:hypothetical protein
MGNSKLDLFEKKQISKKEDVTGKGIKTTYNSGSTGWEREDTWYLFKKNNTSTVDEWNCPEGHTDYR